MSLWPEGVGEELFKQKAKTVREIIEEFYYIKIKKSCSVLSRTQWTKLTEKIHNGKKKYEVFKTNREFIFRTNKEFIQSNKGQQFQ